MSEEGSSSFPVELEPPPPPAPRRHRLITAPSGVVLFACLFLPAVEVCGSPAYPFEAWPVAAPYLLGLVVAILALVRGARARSGLVLAARLLVWVTVVGWTIYLVGVAASRRGEVVPGLVWCAVAGVILWMFGVGRRDEAAAARTTIATAVVCSVFFGVLCVTSPLYGVYVSCAATVGILVGGLEWRRELLRDQPARSVPGARIR